MAAIIKSENISYTSKGVEFVKRYLGAFGNVVCAEMRSKPKEVKYELTLRNDMDEEMVITGALTAGYAGEGPGGTYKVLKMCGFDIDENFVRCNAEFKLTK